MKSKFLTPLELRLVSPWANEGRGEWEFLSDLKYYSELLQQGVVVYKGFRYDQASVPRIPLGYALYGGRYARAAGIHDFYCRNKAIPRKLADKVFLEAMRAENEEELLATGDDPERRARLEGQAITMYSAVRLYSKMLGE